MVVDVVLLRVGVSLEVESAWDGVDGLGVVNVLAHPCTAVTFAQAARSLAHCSRKMPSNLYKRLSANASSDAFPHLPALSSWSWRLLHRCLRQIPNPQSLSISTYPRRMTWLPDTGSPRVCSVVARAACRAAEGLGGWPTGRRWSGASVPFCRGNWKDGFEDDVALLLTMQRLVVAMAPRPAVDGSKCFPPRPFSLACRAAP
jgi:hypothetical protein